MAKLLILALFMASTAFGQCGIFSVNAISGLLDCTGIIAPVTVANLPAASSANKGRIRTVSDGASTTDCTTGSGSATAVCVSNGSLWVSVTSSATGAVLATFTAPATCTTSGGTGTNSCTLTSGTTLAATHNLTTSQPWVACFDGSGNQLGSTGASTSVNSVVATSSSVATITFTGSTTGTCVISSGSVGPAGPTGATGATGAAGSNGTNGTNGAISLIENAGSALTVRGTLNFAGGTSCVDNSGATRTDCTTTGSNLLDHVGLQSETSLASASVVNNIYSYTVPGGALPAGKCIDFQAVFKHTTGSASIIVAFLWGSTTVGNAGAWASTNVSINAAQIRVCNKVGATNSQDIYIYGINTFITNWVTGGIIFTGTSAQDTTANVTLAFGFNPQASGSQGVTLYSAETQVLR